MSIRMRHTRGHTGNRRSHHALKGIQAIQDKESGNLRLPHRLDEATGMYRGKQIFTPKVKTKHESKAKGPSTAPAEKHAHEHAQEIHHRKFMQTQKRKVQKGFLARSRPAAGRKLGAVSAAVFDFNVAVRPPSCLAVEPPRFLHMRSLRSHLVCYTYSTQIFPWRTDI